jgi:hypothetical protein
MAIRESHGTPNEAVDSTYAFHYLLRQSLVDCNACPNIIGGQSYRPVVRSQFDFVLIS